MKFFLKINCFDETQAIDFSKLKATEHVHMALCAVLALAVRVLNLSCAGVPFPVLLVQNDTQQRE